MSCNYPPSSKKPRRRILVLTPRWPYPVIGGDRLRIHHLARQLAARHELTLLSLCQSDDEMTMPLPNDGVFSRAERVHLPAWRSWWQSLAALPTTTPLQVAYYRSARFQAAVDALLPRHDAVLAHLVRTGSYAREASRPRLLEMTDAISMSMDRVRQARSTRPFDLRRVIYRIESQRLLNHERAVAAAFDLVSLVSPVDRDHLFPPPESMPNMLVVPNGVVAPPAIKPDADRDAFAMAFVGNLRTLQNLDAVGYFVEQILPLVLAQQPKAHLRIIGPIAPVERQRLARQRGVTVSGQVDDLTAALADCSIGVCPVRIGAGVQNKLLDYWAHGLAAVTSPVGAEGLAASDGTQLLVARSPDEWATQLLMLVRDPALRASLGAAGRARALEQHQWPACTADWLDRIDALLAAPPRR